MRPLVARAYKTILSKSIYSLKNNGLKTERGIVAVPENIVINILAIPFCINI